MLWWLWPDRQAGHTCALSSGAPRKATRGRNSLPSQCAATRWACGVGSARWVSPSARDATYHCFTLAPPGDSPRMRTASPWAGEPTQQLTRTSWPAPDEVITSVGAAGHRRGPAVPELVYRGHGKALSSSVGSHRPRRLPLPGPHLCLTLLCLVSVAAPVSARELPSTRYLLSRLASHPGVWGKPAR